MRDLLLLAYRIVLRGEVFPEGVESAFEGVYCWCQDYFVGEAVPGLDDSHAGEFFPDFQSTVLWKNWFSLGCLRQWISHTHVFVQ